MVFLYLDNERGLTLIELLITIIISSLMSAAVVNTVTMQRRSYALQEQITDMVQSSRVTMAMMTREIRMAGYNPSGAAFDGITYNTSSTCGAFAPGPRIRLDLNGDGDTNDANEDITYCHDTTNLRLTRNTGSGNEVFAENIVALAFTYLDSNGNVTAVVGDIRQIRVSLTTRTAKPDPNYQDPNDTGNKYRTYTLNSLMFPRNLDV